MVVDGCGDRALLSMSLDLCEYETGQRVRISV